MVEDSSSGPLLPLPRLELILTFATLVLGAVLVVGALAAVQPALLPPLALLLTVALVFNLFLVWLDRHGISEQFFVWLTRLGNLVFLTAGVYLTGGFASPVFSLYAIYLVVASMHYGWSGTTRSFVLCLASWGVLALLLPPTNLQGWVWAAMSVGALFIVALTVGVLAERHIRSRQALERRNREMSFLQEAGQAMSASLDPQQVLATTLAQVNDLMEVDAASLAMVEADTGRIRFELAVGGVSEAIQGLRLEPGEGIVGQVIRTGESLLVPDVASDARWCTYVDQTTGYQTRSLLCVPLRVKGQVIGALEAVNKRDGPFTEEDRRLLSALADLAAPCIENARLHGQLQQYTQRLQEAYHEVQKLDELKSAFIRNVSHELRTPLALIKGYLELLLDGQLGPLQSQQHQSLSLVAAKSAALASMVEDLISLQTIGEMRFDMEVLSLATLVQEAVARAGHKAERSRVALVFEEPSQGEPLLIQGDAHRLRQVFDHLLDNAIKFSPNGGQVQVRLLQKEKMACVQVQDEGIGVPLEHLSHIFDRFYQVNGSSTRRFGGTGLGLALVKEVVEAHGGAVWVESGEESRRGSTFSVFLPVYRERQA